MGIEIVIIIVGAFVIVSVLAIFKLRKFRLIIKCLGIDFQGQNTGDNDKISEWSLCEIMSKLWW